MEIWFVIIPTFLLLISLIFRFLIRLENQGFWEISNVGREFFLEAISIMGIAWLHLKIESDKYTKLKEIFNKMDVEVSKKILDVIAPSIEVPADAIIGLVFLSFALYAVLSLWEKHIEGKDNDKEYERKFKNKEEDYALGFCMYVSTSFVFGLSSLIAALFIYSYKDGSVSSELDRFFWYTGLFAFLLPILVMVASYFILWIIKGTPQSRNWGKVAKGPVVDIP